MLYAGVLNRRPAGRIRLVCIHFVARVMLKINVFLLQFVLKILGSLVRFFNFFLLNVAYTIAVVKAARSLQAL